MAHLPRQKDLNCVLTTSLFFSMNQPNFSWFMEIFRRFPAPSLLPVAGNSGEKITGYYTTLTIFRFSRKEDDSTWLVR
jgi:hypothetical protein